MRAPGRLSPELHPRYQLRFKHAPGLEGMLWENLQGMETLGIPVGNWQREHQSWSSPFKLYHGVK